MTEPEETLQQRLDKLHVENVQLRTALASRIVIEQAKGVLIERLDLPAEQIFPLMRAAARRARMNLHDLSEQILQSRVNVVYIEREIAHLRKDGVRTRR
jgi:AmiR/NasT family two-component response regulator